jgi:flagellar motor switch protein FliN
VSEFTATKLRPAAGLPLDAQAAEVFRRGWEAAGAALAAASGKRVTLADTSVEEDDPLSVLGQFSQPLFALRQDTADGAASAFLFLPSEEAWRLLGAGEAPAGEGSSEEQREQLRPLAGAMLEVLAARVDEWLGLGADLGAAVPVIGEPEQRLALRAAFVNGQALVSRAELRIEPARVLDAAAVFPSRAAREARGSQEDNGDHAEATEVAVFEPLTEGAGEGGAARLDLVMDIPLKVTVELGRTHMLVRDILQLGVGSVVELDKASDEPVDVIVGGKMVARGEVVVVEENFGVRVTKLLNPVAPGKREGGADAGVDPG